MENTLTTEQLTAIVVVLVKRIAKLEYEKTGTITIMSDEKWLLALLKESENIKLK